MVTVGRGHGKGSSPFIPASITVINNRCIQWQKQNRNKERKVRDLNGNWDLYCFVITLLLFGFFVGFFF